MKILIVDDEPIVLESLERLLVGLGPDTWEVSCAGTGTRALEVMATTHVDLLITDMRMPGMDGAELMTETAARWPRVARFALSAEANVEQSVRAAGVAHQFLGKPCSAAAMLAAVTSMDLLSHASQAAAVQAIVSAVPRIPVLPAVFTALREALVDPRSDARKIADIVRRDPSVVAKIMQLANSSFFCRGSAIASVEGAVLRLGAALISRLVLVEGLVGASASMKRYGYDRDARRFFRASIVAEASVSGAARDLASLAVSLCPVGRSLMIAADPDRVELVTTIVAAEEVSIMEAERRVFGTDHAAVGSHLITLWGLPAAVSTAVRLQQAPAAQGYCDEILAAVALATRDARGLGLDASFTALPEVVALSARWDLHATRLGETS